MAKNKGSMQMSRLYKIDSAMWTESQFRALSAPPPNAQTLWIYLLTSQDSPLPGLFPGGEAGLAEAIGWDVKDFRLAAKELVDAGMVEFDQSARLVWIKTCMCQNAPVSPNVVRGWHNYWVKMPKCDLKKKAFDDIHEILFSFGQFFVEAWMDASLQYRTEEIPLEVIAKVRRRDKEKCRYCGKLVKWIKPGASGTYDYLDSNRGATVENVVVACAKCTTRKGFRTPEEAGMTLMQP